MTYVCIDCGRGFDKPAHIEESRGEYWGVKCYEDVTVCPFCHGDFEEKEDESDES